MAEDPNPGDGFLKAVNLVIQKRIDDPRLSVEDLSKAVYLTRFQVHRRLKAATGMNATQYIRSIRLEKAQKMLSETSLPIAQIAIEVGFSDAGFFSRVFKESFGKPPSAFRKDMKNN